MARFCYRPNLLPSPRDASSFHSGLESVDSLLSSAWDPNDTGEMDHRSRATGSANSVGTAVAAARSSPRGGGKCGGRSNDEISTFGRHLVFLRDWQNERRRAGEGTGAGTTGTASPRSPRRAERTADGASTGGGGGGGGSWSGTWAHQRDRVRDYAISGGGGGGTGAVAVIPSSSHRDRGHRRQPLPTQELRRGENKSSSGGGRTYFSSSTHFHQFMQ